MGYFDRDGYLIFQGRRGQVVNKGGLTVSCSRVEQALMKVPGVRDACVVPSGTKSGEKTWERRWCWNRASPWPRCGKRSGRTCFRERSRPVEDMGSAAPQRGGEGGLQEGEG